MKKRIRKPLGLTTHNQRVLLLESLATLSGCCVSYGGELPDGQRPDVMRFDLKRRALFLAEAKDTESFGNKETKTRLNNYLDWFAEHVRLGGLGAFAICVGPKHNHSGWIDMFSSLALKHSIRIKETKIDFFPPDAVVLTFLF
jgi:hypothetical protein